MVVVSQPNQTVIDFYPENGFLVPEVPNQIYFQAWATEAKADYYDFTEAHLVVIKKDNG